MRYTRLKKCIIAFFFSLFFASCSKSNDTNINDSIIGNWNYAEVGVDVNGNNILDAGETKTVGQIGAYGTATFTDNLYSLNYFDGANPYKETGTYTYTNGTLKTNTTSRTPNTYYVKTLTSNRLVLRDAFSSPAYWLVLTR